MAEEQFVLFKLAQEEYAITITQVREIIQYSGATRLPNVPEYMEGVINLRGNTIPVLNLAQRLAIDGKIADGGKKALIVETNKQNFGVVVDEVTEVLMLAQSAIEGPPPNVGEGIRGIGKAGERLLILLDMDRLFKEEAIDLYPTN
ncbi:chemotaxis protein CheW [Anaerosinus massiliensis]|uniref:chemotaxis protein CheW n=1 Tax=Massilibacillus massiliensis TaxID=1806837 RepID=UPI000A95D735|nr:chemotaxis protein CheW [Massilibacillus massiliensis]